MPSKRLPVLFLADIVLLPGMAVPVELDEAALAAVDAARTSAGSELLIAPRLEDRYASYGVVATVERVGKIRGGSPAAVLRTGVRARIGSGVTGPGAALWVEVEPVVAGTPGEHVRELAAEYKQLVVSVLQRREAWQVIDSVSAIDDPSDLADTAGWAPYLSDDRKRELLETPDVEARLRLLIAWTRDFLAESEVSDKIDNGRARVGREAQPRIPAARTAQGDPQGARRRRVRRHRRLPQPRRGGRPARSGPRGRAARGRQAGTRRRPEPRGGLDPELARHGAGPALERPHHRRHRPCRGPGGARRRPPRPGRGQGTHRRVPRRPRPPRGPGPDGRRRPRLRRGHPAGRAARRRQDLAGRVGRAHAGPQVRPGRPRRRPGRGGDPRPPPHVRRRDARPHRAGHPGGRLDEPGRAARRGRQGRQRLPRRPGRGAAGGAGPGAEPHLPRPLPRPGPGPVRRAVHRDRERAGDDPAGAVRPDGADRDRRLHRERQGRHRPRLPRAPAAGAGRPVP